MKLLDPFAGYKLANGHPLFHAAFFAGSFMVNVYSDPDKWYMGTVEEFDELIRDGEDYQRKLTPQKC